MYFKGTVRFALSCCIGMVRPYDMGFVVFRVIGFLQRPKYASSCSPAELPRYILTLKLLYNIYLELKGFLPCT